MIPLSTRAAAQPAPSLRQFVSHQQACSALVARVAADLDLAVERHGVASLAVPGGTTPAEFLLLLGYRDLDWPAVQVTLTDERWVPPTHERSNAALVSRTLGRSGRPYRWFPLWRAGSTAEVAVPDVERESADLAWPLDVVVLGMGDDGHVASLFPGDESGFAAAGPSRFAAVRGPGDEPRISLTASAIARARSVYLLIRGSDKRAVLRAASGSDLPIARVIAARQGKLDVYASP
jgi:6-phosphogluconolactonase